MGLQWHPGTPLRTRTLFLGKPFYLVFSCKQFNLILTVEHVLSPPLQIKKYLYGQLLIIWDSAENILLKEAIPGPPISSSSFHLPVPSSLFYYPHFMS